MSDRLPDTGFTQYGGLFKFNWTPSSSDQILISYSQVRQEGGTVLLVEQNAYDALKLAHWGYVLETGSIVTEGEANKLLNDENVRKAYLGM
jgi:branched-chain amino acid transport system ATP-binding protein